MAGDKTDSFGNGACHSSGRTRQLQHADHRAPCTYPCEMYCIRNSIERCTPCTIADSAPLRYKPHLRSQRRTHTRSNCPTYDCRNIQCKETMASRSWSIGRNIHQGGFHHLHQSTIDQYKKDNKPSYSHLLSIDVGGRHKSSCCKSHIRSFCFGNRDRSLYCIPLGNK